MKAVRYLLIFIQAWAFAGPDYVKDQWILIPQTSRTSWRDVIGDKRVRFLKQFGPRKQFALVKGERGILKTLRGLKKIQRNFIYSIADSFDPDFEKSWGLKNTGQVVADVQGLAGVDIDMERAWEIFKGDKNVIVAILDSGINLSHEDLSQNIWKSSDIANNKIDDDGNGFVDDVFGWNFISHNANTNDDYSHGTFIAGIIGASAQNNRGTRGINWHVQLMPVKMIDSQGFGTSESAISAVTYAVENGAQVVNTSWKTNGFDQALYNTIQWADAQGVLFVASAGNDAVDNDSSENAAYPASFDLPNLISVAAYTSNDKLASFSNYGKETVSIGAPGVNIYSANLSGYRFGNGTSYAAPFVTGVAALLKGFAKDLSARALKDRILATSTPLFYYEKENTQSAGRVNAYQALKNDRPPRPISPTQWKSYTVQLSTSHPYQNNKVESLTVQHPGASFIRVHFSKFKTEKTYDVVTLKDSQGRVVRSYSGELGSFSAAEALGDTLVIEFKPDFHLTDYGFDIDRYDVSGSSD